jgi:hypothetical protein
VREFIVAPDNATADWESWWRDYVKTELARLNDNQVQLRADFTAADKNSSVDIAALTTQARIWGAIAGLVGGAVISAVIGLIIWLLMK